MTRFAVRVLTLVAVSLALAAPAAGQTQTPPPAPPAKPATPAQTAAVADLEKIRQALSREPTLKLNEQQLRFYVEVVGKVPTIQEILGDYDLKYGPTRGGAPMTHQEFLAMVTPQEMYGSAGITASELLQGALFNWFAQTIVKKGIEEIRNARSEQEIRDIRARIDRELAALRGGK